MRQIRQYLVIVVVLLFGAFTVYGTGERFNELVADGKVYHDVRVKKVTPKALLILHSGGLAQVLLKDLSPELQKQFGYDPESEAEFEAERVEEIQARVEARAKADAEKKAYAEKQRRSNTWPITQPQLLAEVDLRPAFSQYGLGLKDQNKRASCAIFSVVTALEYEYARQFSRKEELSEEFLIWAIRKYDDPNGGFGQGFSLYQTARRASIMGVAENNLYRETMGYDFKSDPPEQILQDAARRKGVKIRYLNAKRGTEAFFNQAIHALNAGNTVIVGVDWPHAKTIQSTTVLNKQPPVSRHAVNLVGYRSPTGKREDVRFIFKNSWGRDWGVGGYGFMTYEYFINNVTEAFTLHYL